MPRVAIGETGSRPEPNAPGESVVKQAPTFPARSSLSTYSAGEGVQIGCASGSGLVRQPFQLHFLFFWGSGKHTDGSAKFIACLSVTFEDFWFLHFTLHL